MIISDSVSFHRSEPISYIFGVTLVICRKCFIQNETSLETGQDLAAAAARIAKGSGISVRQIACLGKSLKGLKAALVVPHGWNYLFDGLRVSDARALVDGATALSFSGDGQMRWDEWPVPLQQALTAQLPSWDVLF